MNWFEAGLSTAERDALLDCLEKAILSFADERIGSLAGSVQHELQKIPASGVWGMGFKSVWDEYCYEVQEGPTPQLRGAFEATVDPMLDYALSRLPDTEAVLISFAADASDPSSEPRDWIGGDPTIAPDIMRRLLRESLDSLAIDRDLGRFLE